MTRSDMWRFTQSLVSVSTTHLPTHPTPSPLLSLASYFSYLLILFLLFFLSCTPLFHGYQLGKGMYSSRKFEFIHMRAQVTNLWALGDIVRSGVVVDSTRVGVVRGVVGV